MELFAQSDKIVMSSLMRVCEKKLEMLKDEKFDMKAYNALDIQETTLKALMVQFKTAFDFLKRITPEEEPVKAEAKA